MLGAKDPKAENVSLAFAHQEYLHNFEEILRVSCVAEHIDEWHDANDARKRVGRSAAGAEGAGARASAGAEMDVETREEGEGPLDATQQLRQPEERREEHVSEVEEPQVHNLTAAALEQHDAAGGAGSGASKESIESVSLLLSEDVNYEVDSNGDDWTVEKITAHKLFAAFEVMLEQDFADYEAGA